MKINCVLLSLISLTSQWTLVSSTRTRGEYKNHFPSVCFYSQMLKLFFPVERVTLLENHLKFFSSQVNKRFRTKGTRGEKSPWSLVRLHSFPAACANRPGGQARGLREGGFGAQSHWKAGSGTEDPYGVQKKSWVGWNQIRNNFPHV